MATVDKIAVFGDASGKVSGYFDRMAWANSREYRMLNKDKMLVLGPAVTRTLIVCFATADDDGMIDYMVVKRESGNSQAEMNNHLRFICAAGLMVKTVRGRGTATNWVEWRLTCRLTLEKGKSGAAPVADDAPESAY